MVKRASLLALILCLFLFLLSPVSVQAGDRLTILDSSVEVDFPLKLNFSLSAESDVNITEIRLHYTVERMSYAQVTSEVYLEFAPATRVEAEWSWDMRKTGGLPPGSTVGYWWTVEDAKDDRIETELTKVKVDDARYPWQSLTEGKVTLFWYEGDESFVRELMAAGQQVLVRLAEDTGAAPEKPVNIYIYASSQDLLGAMIFPQEWTGGVAFSRHGIIAIGIPPTQLAWGKRATVHELTHLVIHQATKNPFGDIPTWLDEGLAVYMSGELDSSPPDDRAMVSSAAKQGRLMTLQTLSSSFPADSEQARLAYAQSGLIVEFIIKHYGKEAMAQLLEIFSKGSLADDALKQALGVDTWGLDNAWRQNIGAPSVATPVPAGGTPPAAGELTPAPTRAPGKAATPAGTGRTLPCLGSSLTGTVVLALFVLFRARGVRVE